eukprot:CAMPEP_0168513158 /NCGR_PEP_ID=MMETSP0405-20121227/3269_1 /TAXON_ID=498012 /ORGANISM="Trichosphaerium sp, Strain Am-I-7 wt" /LENGTH=385 /DNA_ID=CAMNT_0008531883 /DNA_START=245 /DNA_END=1399 /DNA_ORIENTATION=+
MDKTTEVEQIYQSFMDDATISFIWAPIGLDTARRAAEVALENHWALFSYANKDPYINTFNRRLLPLSISEANLYKRVLAPLRVAGAHNVTIILSSEQIHSKDPGPMKCAHPLFLEAIELNFLKFNNSFLESTPRSPDESISSEWEEEMYPKLLDMMERDPDIWIFCDGDPAAENWYIRKMREAGYTPRAFVGLKQSMDDYDEDTIDYRSAIALFASDVDYPPDSFNTTMKDYNKDFYARFGRNMSEPSIDALIGAQFFKYALERIDAGEVYAHINNNTRMGLIKQGTLPSDSMSCSKDAAVNDGGFLKLQDEIFISGLQHRIETLIGRISWNAQGEQQIETFMSQYFRGKFHAVAPEELQTGNISLVYPMPTWDERIFNPTFGHW